MFVIKGVAAGLAAVRSACSPLAMLNLLVPRSAFVAHRGLAFGEEPRQRLDIYVPRGLAVSAPMLLFFHGGGWQGGRRADYLAFGQVFASAGIVTAVADYRLYPQVKYPAFVEDAAAALVWLHLHGADYGGDPARLFVSGHSAGAYNAVMLASEPAFLAAKGADLGLIRGVIGIAGPYDFLPMEQKEYVDMFHGRNNPDSMPVHHVTGPRPPMLLVTGAGDRTVSPKNTKSMAARLRSLSSTIVEIHYRGIGHVGILFSLLPGFRWLSPLRQDMLNFIRSA
ncbi:MAG TPA: alpha/beta hydrolase [Rhizomicrobium sp.]|nr:alpha/beta hydrolase [Rhizomicrobium sp.]